MTYLHIKVSKLNIEFSVLFKDFLSLKELLRHKAVNNAYIIDIYLSFLQQASAILMLYCPGYNSQIGYIKKKYFCFVQTTKPQNSLTVLAV